MKLPRDGSRDEELYAISIKATREWDNESLPGCRWCSIDDKKESQHVSVEH